MKSHLAAATAVAVSLILSSAPVLASTADGSSPLGTRPIATETAQPLSEIPTTPAAGEASGMELISKVLKIYREDDDADSAAGSKAKRKATKRSTKKRPSKRSRRRTAPAKPASQTAVVTVLHADASPAHA